MAEQKQKKLEEQIKKPVLSNSLIQKASVVSKEENLKKDSVSSPTPASDKKASLKVNSVDSKQTNFIRKTLNLDNIRFGKSINLMVRMSKEEVVVEKKKSQFNYGGALTILFFVTCFVLIMLVNVYYKMQVVKEKNDLYNNIEPQVLKNYNKIESLDDISKRVKIYNDKGGSKIVYHDTLKYWEEVSKNIASVEKITVSDDYQFNVSGEADSLKQAAIMWNFMSTDDSILNANLKSVGKSSEGASFQFEGALNEKYFLNLEKSE